MASRRENNFSTPKPPLIDVPELPSEDVPKQHPKDILEPPPLPPAPANPQGGNDYWENKNDAFWHWAYENFLPENQPEQEVLPEDYYHQEDEYPVQDEEEVVDEPRPEEEYVPRDPWQDEYVSASPWHNPWEDEHDTDSDYWD